MTAKRAPKKKQLLEAMPDTCGGCRHGHDVSGQVFLLCYGRRRSLWPTSMAA